MEALEIVEAAKDAQGKLRHIGLSIDERGMPRDGTLPVWATKH